MAADIDTNAAPRQNCRSSDQGVQTSAEARTAEVPRPPVMSTRPLVSRVAVSRLRAIVIDPALVNLPVAGSYSSALAMLIALFRPPAISTRPSVSRVEVGL